MKNLLKVAIALLIAVAFASCAPKNVTYKVTVIEKIGYDALLGGQKVRVTTESGDTLISFIEEKFLLTKKIPFTAEMEKNPIGRFGFIYEKE